MQTLRQKQGGEQHFSTAAERDAWIRKEVAQLQEAIGKKQGSKTALEQQMQRQEDEATQLAQEIGDLEHKLHESEAALAQQTK